jgi:hypothetical protein
MNKLIGLFFSLIILLACSVHSANEKPVFTEGPIIIVDSGLVVSAHLQSSRIGVRILQ